MQSVTYRYVLLGVLFLSFGCTRASHVRQPESTTSAERHRVVILTDMTHDDGNSLIRYLHYAPYFDTEAIIVTPQLPDFPHDATAPWEKAEGILSAYARVRDQLEKHESGYPTREELMRVMKRGRGALPIIWLTEEREFAGDIAGRYVESTWGEIRFSDWIGEGLTPNGESRDSEGSEFLQEVFDRDDDRPIYVQLWGGPVTFSQSLYRYGQRQGPEKLDVLLNKLHVYSIHLQDITLDYLVDLDALRETDCAHFGEARSTFEGQRVAPRNFLLDMGHFWRYIRAIDDRHVIGHGPLSDLYDGGGEGDTPAFLYLIGARLGLNDPQDPTHGSWGNMFYSMGKPFPESHYHTCPGSPEQLERWLPAATNSFIARLQWAIREPDEANHAPIAIVNGEASHRPLRVRLNPGETFVLDAGDSSDPDDDALQYRWFRYAEADTYPGEFRLARPAEPVQSIAVPADIGDQNIHLVLEIRDDGEPELVAYKRVIITAE